MDLGQADAVGKDAPGAPPLLHVSGGVRLDLRRFAGQPVVISFWEGVPSASSCIDSAEWAQARAELRGLGAVLLVVSHGGLWFFSPDDEAELHAAPGTLAPAELAALRAWLGRADIGSGLFVLDGQLNVRFGQALASDGARFPALVDALAVAGRALAAAPAARFTLTRRHFVVTSLVAAFAAAFSDSCGSAHSRAPSPGPGSITDELEMSLHINGVQRTVKADTRLTLLDALRERLDMPGTKKGCDQGQCGACTVLIDGRRVNACLTLAVMVQDVPIVTIEGVAKTGVLHPMQVAFVAEDGFQCGYCTSGQIMSALGLRAECRAQQANDAVPGDDDVRERMSGNICRCGAYPNIVAAIKRAWKDT